MVGEMCMSDEDWSEVDDTFAFVWLVYLDKFPCVMEDSVLDGSVPYIY